MTFDDVHFDYGTGDEVLHDVEFHMAPGEVVALVGPSGAGKTSVANLLCRFYDPIHGQIAVDGHDLRQVRLASLRRQVAVVLQDTFLFNSTVRDNLLYGKPDASDEEIVAAAKAAYAHEFIEALPQGYDTEIGERGVKLSGGQKQRLALARAILADPRILILDEATSSVDAEAEYLIQQALESVLRGPHGAGDRPPAEHDPQRRQDHRPGGGPHRRGRRPPGSCWNGAGCTASSTGGSSSWPLRGVMGTQINGRQAASDMRHMQIDADGSICVDPF